LSAARYILIGGFPGAGKTTALAAAARHLQQHGRRVGIIANDNGSELVDRVMLRAGGFAPEEVSGGSLAGRFSSLLQVARRLEKAGAELVLVEPVGSSADLLATVAAPLQRELSGACVLAPLSMLVDPRRAEEAFGLAEERPWNERLRGLFRRQLEEADLIVIAQADRLDDERRERLRAKLAAEFPQAQVLAVSARDGRGLPEWLARLEQGGAARPAREIDYEQYGQAVAQLGWLDAVIEFTLAKTASGSALLQSVGRHLQAALGGLELVHLKIALRTEESAEAGLLQLTRPEEKPELVRPLVAPLETGELIVNLRAETNPEKLHTGLRAAIVELTREFPGLQVEFAHLHSFQPAKPVPPAS